MMEAFTVGQKVMSPCYDTVRFEMTSAGALLIVAMRQPSAREKRAFKSGPMQLKFTVVNDIIFILVRFGTEPWLDAPYNRALSKPFFVDVPSNGDGLTMHALLVDADTGILVDQKIIGLDHQLSVNLIRAIDAQPQIANYERVLSSTYMRYTTEDLLKTAEG